MAKAIINIFFISFLLFAGIFSQSQAGLAQVSESQNGVYNICDQELAISLSGNIDPACYKNNTNSTSKKTIVDDNPEVAEEENETENENKHSNSRSSCSLLFYDLISGFIVQSTSPSFFESYFKLPYNKGLYLLFCVIRI